MPPFGHSTQLRMFVDPDMSRYDEVLAVGSLNCYRGCVDWRRRDQATSARPMNNKPTVIGSCDVVDVPVVGNETASATTVTG